MISARTQAEARTIQTVSGQTFSGRNIVPAAFAFRGLKSSFRLSGLALLASGAALAMAGCGNNYRPVVSAINPVGPASQPTKYAVAISNPGINSPGLVTIVDVSGDTVLVTPNIDANPYYLQLASGYTGYTLHPDGSLNSFSISSSLQTRNILQSTLLPGSNAVSILAQGTSNFLAEAGRNAVAQLQSAPPAVKQEITTGPGTIYTVGLYGAPRVYALSQGTPTGSVYPNGTATAIDTSTVTPTNSIPVGVQPTYGVMTADTRRAFIMNKGSGTVSVINSQTNQLDTFTKTFNITGFSIAGNVVTITAPNTFTAGTPVSIAGLTTGTYLNGQSLTVLASGLSNSQFQAAFTHANVASTADSGTATGVVSTIQVGAAPLWADFSPLLNEMFVLNAGNPGGPDTLINGYSVAAGVATFSTSPQQLTAGQTVTLASFPTSTFLNGQKVTVLAAGLTPTSFEATVTGSTTAAATTEAGLAYSPSFTVSGYSINSTLGVMTVSTSAQSLTAGQQVTLGGFPASSSFLNGQTVTVSSTGLSSTSFQAFFSHATVTSADAGAGVINGSVSVVSIPLCGSALYTNPNCDVANPVDAAGFGTVVATINVGVNPTVVGVLQDASQAFVANAGSIALGIPGSVSAINQQSEIVVATIPASNASTDTPTDSLVHGNPTFLAVTTGTPTGKIYVTAPNSNDMTIIRTDTDTIQTHISLQGAGVMVRTSVQ